MKGERAPEGRARDDSKQAWRGGDTDGGRSKKPIVTNIKWRRRLSPTLTAAHLALRQQLKMEPSEFLFS